MNKFMQQMLRNLGYEPQPTEVLGTGGGSGHVGGNPTYVAVAIKTTVGGRTSVAKALGKTETQAEQNLVNMLYRP